MSSVNPSRVESLEVNETEDGLVVYDPASGMVHHLNASAAVIFDLADGTRDVAAIARVLGEAFALEAPPLEAATGGLSAPAERGPIPCCGHRSRGWRRSRRRWSSGRARAAPPRRPAARPA